MYGIMYKNIYKEQGSLKTQNKAYETICMISYWVVFICQTSSTHCLVHIDHSDVLGHPCPQEDKVLVTWANHTSTLGPYNPKQLSEKEEVLKIPISARFCLLCPAWSIQIWFFCKLLDPFSCFPIISYIKSEWLQGFKGVCSTLD